MGTRTMKAFAAATVLLVGVCVAASPVKKKRSLPQRLLDESPDVRKQAREEVLGARSALIKGLLQIVEGPENQAGKRDSVRKAIHILGRIRAVEASKPLAEIIGWPRVLPGKGIPSSPSVGGTTPDVPVVEALKQIGEPCSKAVLDKVARTDSHLEIRACLDVLTALRRNISGPEDTLKGLISSEKDPKRRARLELGLRLLRKAKSKDND